MGYFLEGCSRVVAWKEIASQHVGLASNSSDKVPCWSLVPGYLCTCNVHDVYVLNQM